MSTTNAVSPLCFGRSGSVRHTISPMSERCAPEVQTFWPVTIHSSPSRVALAWTDGKVAPGAGLAEELAGDDVAPVHLQQVPLCGPASVAWARIVGATIPRPMP